MCFLVNNTFNGRIVRNKTFALLFEEKFNRAQSGLKQNGDIDEDFYKAARSTGVQSARLYGLAKVIKRTHQSVQFYLHPVAAMLH